MKSSAWRSCPELSLFSTSSAPLHSLASAQRCWCLLLRECVMMSVADLDTTIDKIYVSSNSLQPCPILFTITLYLLASAFQDVWCWWTWNEPGSSILNNDTNISLQPARCLNLHYHWEENTERPRAKLHFGTPEVCCLISGFKDDLYVPSYNTTSATHIESSIARVYGV